MTNQFLTDLNQSQREAALESDNLMVLAGPGSGKTKTIAAKSAILLSQAKKVVAVTFTRDSAVEIRNRIMHLTQNQYRDNLLVGTFHGLCYILLSPPKTPQYGRNILNGCKGLSGFKDEIASEGERLSYVHRAIDIAMITDLDIDEASSLIEEAKSMFALDITMSVKHKRLFIAYQEVLKRDLKVDLQDLITETVKGLRSGNLMPFRADALLVDESQDIDQLQYEWIAQHARLGIKTTLVGDDDQSIYGWRQALGHVGMEKFAQEFSAKRVTLNVNYRCKHEILNSAMTLVNLNIGRLSKDLKASKGIGGHIEYKRFNTRRYSASDENDTSVTNSELSEMESMAIDIEKLREQGSCAVIGRTNSVLDDVEEQMLSFNIPYLRQGGRSIMDRREAAVFSGILELIFNRNKRSGVNNILSWAGVSEESLREIHSVLGENIVGIGKLPTECNVMESERKLINTFNTRVKDWRALKDRSAILVIDGIMEWMKEHAKSEYAIKISMAFANILANIDEPLDKRLEVLRKRKAKKEISENEVVLTTAHSSKGLEWDNVWVVAVDQEVFPDKKGGLEEERRLMYVAMTRARQYLRVSSARIPSQFIDEAGLLLTPAN